MTINQLCENIGYIVQQSIKSDFGTAGRGNVSWAPSKNQLLDTGNLKNSIQHYVEDYKSIIFSDVNYAAFIHFGTSKMTDRAFMFTTNKDQQNINVVVEQYVEEFFGN